jgi:stage II sporulation protein D
LKALLFYLVSVSLALILLPALIVGGWWKWEGKNKEGIIFIPPQEITAGESIPLKIYIVEKNELVEMELEQYITGVVSAEMPASFHPEALKAQAVVARTYALRKSGAGGGSGCQNHPGADLCTDSTCCQAWESEKAALHKWPAQDAAFYMGRIREAVYSTRGLVATYQGNLISAVYHSTCGGKTEAALEVWSSSTAHPYLQSTECTYCQHSPYYRAELSMDLSTYTAVLGKDKEALPVLKEGKIPLLEVVQRSKSGRNLLVRIGSPGRLYSGSEVRGLLGLPSTYFQWRAAGEKIIFSTRGHGHGVGMCQYGADGLAKEGKDFLGILQYYYQGIEVESYDSFSGRQDENAAAQGPKASHQPAVTPADMMDPSDFRKSPGCQG